MGREEEEGEGRGGDEGKRKRGREEEEGKGRGGGEGKRRRGREEEEGEGRGGGEGKRRRGREEEEGKGRGGGEGRGGGGGKRRRGREEEEGKRRGRPRCVPCLVLLYCRHSFHCEGSEPPSEVNGITISVYIYTVIHCRLFSSCYVELI